MLAPQLCRWIGVFFFVIVRTVHLLASNRICQFLAQLHICSRSFWSSSASHALCITQYNRQSYANNLILELVCWPMSFMYRMSIKGLSTVPCGTPDLTAVSSEDSPSTTTHCVRPVSQFFFYPSQCLVTDTAVLEFTEETFMGNKVKSFGEIQNQKVQLLFIIQSLN